MLIIGLLLLIVAVIFGADLVWQNSFHISGVTAFGQSLGITNAAAFFVIGRVNMIGAGCTGVRSTRATCCGPASPRRWGLSS